MGIIIGYGTSASIGGTCAVSASWSASPNTQRLYCLNGSFDPVIEISKATQTVNMTVYSPGPSVSVVAASQCEPNSGDISVSINPGSCGGGGATAGVSGQFYVTSYSYSREDTSMPGQESWSLIRYIGNSTPTFVLKGIAEGQWTEGSGVDGDATASATAGSVSAGGMGRADTLSLGIVRSVGGGTSSGPGTGQASVSRPLTPLWI